MSGIELSTKNSLQQTRINRDEEIAAPGLVGILNRLLNGAGGDRTNAIFASSFVVLFVVIAVLSVSSDDGTHKINQPQPYIGTTNLKAPEHHRQVQERPTNVSIAFVGDSMSRYTYLSLVYYLRWGRWFDPGLEKSNLVDERSFDNPFHDETFNEFAYQTNIMLQPYELCDYHKHAKKPNMRKAIFENRYYHDPVYNNTVTFIHAYPDGLPTQGRLKAQETYTSKGKWSAEEDGLMDSGWSRLEWKHDTWHELISEYLGAMIFKPEFVVLTASGELSPLLKGTQYRTDIHSATKKTGIHPFWMMAPFDKKHNKKEEDMRVDSWMCDLLESCVDVAWTKDLKDSLYLDESLFFEPVYRVISEGLLGNMGYLPEGYEHFNRSSLLLE